MKIRQLILAAILFNAFACEDAESPSEILLDASDTTNISDTTEVNALIGDKYGWFPGVVYYDTWYWNKDTGQAENAACSGTMISSNAVMTAWHCYYMSYYRDIAMRAVYKDASGTYRCITGTNSSTSFQDAYANCDYRVVSGYGKGSWGDDFGVLVSPTTWTGTGSGDYNVIFGGNPKKAWNTWNAVSLAQNGGNAGVGTLRIGAFTISTVESEQLTTAPNKSYRICHGDSGSGLTAYLSGINKVAVSATVVINTEESNGCATAASSTIWARAGTKSKIKWLEQTLGQNAYSGTSDGHTFYRFF